MAKKRIKGLGKYEIGIVKHQAGGMNNYVSPTILTDIEAKLLKNVSLKEKGVVQPCLGRLKRFSSTFDANNPCNGLYAFYPDTTTSRLIMGAGTKIYQDTPHITNNWTDQADFEETNSHACNCDTVSTAGDIKVNTTKATANFTRATTKYKKDGTGVASGNPTYEAGEFNNGYHAEESTTNILTENLSSVETNTTGFIAYQGATITRVTTEYWHGSASLKVETPGSVVGEGVYTDFITVTADNIYTFSVYVKGVAGQSVFLGLREYNASSQSIGITNSDAVAMDGTWQRITITRAFGATGVKAILYIRVSGVTAYTFYADGLQLEQKPYATSWHLGGATRNADSLYYTLPSALPNEWFISGFWKPDQASTMDRANALTLFELYLDVDNRFVLNYTTSADKIRFYKEYQNTGVNLYTDVISYNAGDIIAYAAAQLTQAHGDLPAGMHLWYRINDGSVVHLSNTDINLPTAPTKVYTGCYTSTGYECNGVIDAVKLVDIAATEASGAMIDNAWAESFLTAETAPTADNATLMLCQFDDATDAEDITGFVWITDKKDVSAAVDTGSGKVEYANTTPGSSTMAFRTRTSADGVNWDAWTAIDASGNIGSTHKDYIQLAVTGTINSTDKPSLQSVTLSYDGTPTATVLQTGFTIGGQFYFTTLNGTLIEMNKLNAPMKWDGITENMSALGGSPPHCQYVAAHKNRLFAAYTSNYPSRLYYTDALTIETWGALSYIDINPDDGDYITGLLVYDDYLIITKNRSVWVLVGNSPSDFAVKRISSSVGCVAPRSLIRMDEFFSFVSSEGIYRSDLSAPVLISERLKETWDALNKRRLNQAASAYYDHILRVDLPYGSSTTNNYTICYGSIGQHLYVKDLTNHASCYTTMTEAGEEILLFGHSTEGQVSREDYSTSDDGVAIAMNWETKHFDHGLTAIEKKIKKLLVTIIANTSDVTVNVYLIVDGVENAKPLTFTATGQVIRKALVYELRPSEINVRKFNALGYRITTSSTNGGVKFTEIVPVIKLGKLRAS